MSTAIWVGFYLWTMIKPVATWTYWEVQADIFFLYWAKSQLWFFLSWKIGIHYHYTFWGIHLIYSLEENKVLYGVKRICSNIVFPIVTYSHSNSSVNMNLLLDAGTFLIIGISKASVGFHFDRLEILRIPVSPFCRWVFVILQKLWFSFLHVGWVSAFHL